MNNLENSLQKINQVKVSIEILKDMKVRAHALLTLIEKLEKLQGSNKKSREAKKVVNKFICCHLTSPAIYKRYHEVMLLMERFKNGV